MKERTLHTSIDGRKCAPDNCGFGAQGVLCEGVLHLRGAHPVARHVEHVVNAACDPDVAVLVPPSTITTEVVPLQRWDQTIGVISIEL